MTRSPNVNAPRALLAAGLLAALAGCAAKPVPTQFAPAPRLENLDFVPDFARKPYEPFSRSAAIAIAWREWRLFGQPIDDDPPGTRPEPPPDLKPEREQGLWQRVGEYWWLGVDPSSDARGWTGKHDQYGLVFDARRDGDYAWSAAFIGYVMRIADAGSRFPYSPSHSTYIAAAARVARGSGEGWVVEAERPDAYAPQLGDLICTGRDSTRALNIDALPSNGFSSHCDIVVQVVPGSLSVIGGNVDDAVTMKHVPVNSLGMLAQPGGQVIDPRYPWFTVIRVLYDAP